MSLAENWRFPLLLLFAGCVAADGGDDFSNNLFSDLAPLLALFGERVTMQFMSQSMGWADNVILAMAPLGIITVIISAIRVGGPSWLKAIIGRARENLAVAEADLMSSTSHEVCELWNGQEIVRCMGSAPITEFICLLPASIEKGPKVLPHVKISYLDTAIKRGCLGNIQLNVQEDFRRWRDSQKSSGRREDTEKHQTDSSTPEITIIRNRSTAAPNISLNSHNQSWRGELRTAAVFGTILQFGVLMYSGLATYYPTLKFSKDDRPIADYAFPCATVGTLVLVAGMMLCGHVVESSTKEEKYRAHEGQRARLVWLQQTKTVSDQVFDSFAIFAQEDQDVITTSRRVDNGEESAASAGRRKKMSTTIGDKTTQNVVQQIIENEPDRDTTSQTDTRSDTTKKQDQAAILELKAVIGTGTTLCGYIVQFIGLRGMHWSVSVAQLGAILVMAVLRAWVRRGLAKPPQCERLPQGFELEWFVTMMLGNPNSPLWQSNISDRDAETIKDWRIVTGGYPDNYGSVKAAEGGDLNDRNSEAHMLMTIRRDLGRLADWRSPVSAEAISLARAIEVAMDALFGSSLAGKFTWSVRVHCAQTGVQSVNFRLEQQDGAWKAYADEVEAALSLWLYSVNEQEQCQHQQEQQEEEGPETKPPVDDAWLRARGSPAKRSLRLLGSYAQGLHRDLCWWMPGEAVRVMEVEESEDGAHEVENHRIVGFGSGFGGASLKQGGRTRYRALELAKLSFDWTDKDTMDRGRAKNAHLAAESYGPGTSLYAQEMFSAFMWAAAKKLENPMAGSADIRPDGTSGNTAWQSFTLRNDQLSRMALDIHSTGLGSLEDVYLGIIPPLSIENKLPQADAIIELARHHAKRHEQLGHWREAGEAYLWLFQIAKTFPEQSAFVAKATAILVEYLRQVTSAIGLRRAQRAAGDLQQLKWLKLDLKKELKPNIEKELKTGVPGIFSKLMTLYADQGRPWTCQFLHSDTDGEIRVDIGEGDSDGDGEETSAGDSTSDEESVDLMARKVALDEENPSNGEDNLERETSDGQDMSGSEGASDEENPSDGEDKLERETSGWEDGLERETSDGQDMFGREDTSDGGTTSEGETTSEGDTTSDEENTSAGKETVYPDVFKFTKLHRLAQVDEVKQGWLYEELQKNKNADPKDIHDWTPLHYAAAKGCVQVVDMLLQRQADVNARDLLEWTPLHYSCRRGKTSIIRHLLRQGADVDAQGRDGVAPLHCAAIKGHLAGVSSLIQAGAAIDVLDASGLTPLLWAAYKGHKDVVRDLWPDANKKLRDQNGRTALHLAAVAGNEEVVEQLLALGADNDARDRDGVTPLHLATENGHADLARLLIIEAGADKDARQRYGATPLHIAAENGHVDLARFLVIEACAKKEAKEPIYGRTPLHVAAESGQLAVARLLVFELGANKEAKEDHGYSPLHLAAANGNVDVARLLVVEAGANKEATDLDLQTPLHLAAKHGHEAVARLLAVEVGADAEAKAYNGRTPLHLARKNGHEAVARMLVVEAGADEEAKDHNGQTPQQVVAEGPDYFTRFKSSS